MPVCVESSSVAIKSERKAESSLSARVRQRLRQSPYPVLRKISIYEHEGVLTLHGVLPSFYLKQLAQVTVAKVSGVEKIHNRIEVIQSPVRCRG
jgi:osmotically-inducible protein OsmY